MAGDEPEDQPRPLSAPLLLAILALPVLFVWLLLRPGYSRDLRIGAFLYVLLFPAAQLSVLLLAPGGADGSGNLEGELPASSEEQSDDDDDDDEGAEADRDVAVHGGSPSDVALP